MAVVAGAGDGVDTAGVVAVPLLDAAEVLGAATAGAAAAGVDAGAATAGVAGAAGVADGFGAFGCTDEQIIAASQ